ncbi:MAG: Holliday junction branch migration DNA helicase RuvB [Dehalococcoidia bacterium]|nr:Holliday junction branch migration DNA helicase RuvB [Dehalococcoidia bacterium]
MAREPLITGDVFDPGPGDELDAASAPPSEREVLWSLRPRTLDEYIGQQPVVDNLRVAITAARRRGEPLDHVLFHGPPGLGKTTLAHIIATEMGATITHTSGPALEKPGDIVGLLSNLDQGEVIFIDEVHRLSHTVEEYLYSAMEDFSVDIVTGQGPKARSLRYRLEHFTLIGATTRAGLISAPLRDRFGIVCHLDFYSDVELAAVVTRSARLLDTPIDDVAALEIAKRARGTPRVANRLLRRVRDYAEVHGTGSITPAIAADALTREGVDERGLDRLDRAYLTTIIEGYQGGPVGLEALAATINEETGLLADVVEPFLLKIGFVSRTPTGRKATELSRVHLGYPPAVEQPRLL